MVGGALRDGRFDPRQADGATPFSLAIGPRLAPSLVVTVCVALSLIVAGLGMALYNEHQAAAQQARALAAQADALSHNIAAPLAAGDAGAVRDDLVALKQNPQIEAAAVLGPTGAELAGWSRDGSPPGSRLVSRPSGDGLAAAAPVSWKGAALGMAYLRAVREPWLRRLARYGGIGLLILMAAVAVAGLGASNASLIDAQRRLRREMTERARAEEALLRSQRTESERQLADATERGRAALRQSQAQLEFALLAGDLGSWTRDLRTGALHTTVLFRAHHGLGPNEPLRSLSDIARCIHPDDRAEQLRRSAESIADRTVFASEYRTLASDGTTRWLLVRGQADYADDGTPLQMAGVSMDITARKAAEDRQRLLLDELNHRVKNTLAVVQSIALQTGGAAETAEAFESAFAARINALARVHDLLSEAAWEGASLAEVVSQTLAPYLARGQGGRIGFDGPDVKLGPNAAVTLAMAFHELATNAAKYGALSAAAGRIQVSWRAAEQERGPLEILWTERGGPPAVQPARRGFGAQFLERALAREFDGEVNLGFTLAGLDCRMRLPLSAKLRLTA